MLRIGHGYDVHRLETGRGLIIGGVRVPHEKGLDGHSDADVLAHAIIDSLLGALCLGDIGKLFPDSDEAYKNADSIGLLCRVTAIMRELGFTLCNLDSTVMAEKPRLAPYIPEMRRKLAEAFGCELGRINVKATTEEGLGFTGIGLGMAAHAVILLEGNLDMQD